jgi:hypothetical protein
VAANLGASLAIIEKRRLGNNDSTEALNVIGEVSGRVALTVDDEIDTAGSLTNVVETLLKKGATEYMPVPPMPCCQARRSNGFVPLPSRKSWSRILSLYGKRSGWTRLP